MKHQPSMPRRPGFRRPNRLVGRMRPGTTRSHRRLRPALVLLEDRRLLAVITLASFSGGDSPFDPDSLIVDGQGNFFGTTEGALGTVFEIPSGSTSIKTVATFDGADGDGPDSIVENGQGDLFGTTLSGGNDNWGTVFEVALGQGSSTINAIHSFDNATTGANPACLIINDLGDLYGTCLNGPYIEDLVPPYEGTVFSSVDAWGTGSEDWFNGTNGSAPNSLVLGSDGNLYGTTLTGSGADAYGTVFEIKLSGTSPTAITTLAVFNGVDGANPDSLVVDSQGNLYGTTEVGGTYGYGAVFEIANGSNTITTLASFDNADGDEPTTLVLDGQGNLYGTTASGGDSDPGTVFEIAKGSNTITTLVSFDGANGSDPTDLILNPQGNMLLGTAGTGGASSSGTVFAIPLSVDVNSAWANDATGTPVATADGGTDYVGEDAFGTIQAGLDAVNPGGTVNVEPGTYTETDTIAQNATIDGAGASAVTVNGANAGRVFTVAPGVTATVSGLTITGGDGGVTNEGTLTLTDCTIQGNSATSIGGGILNDGYDNYPHSANLSIADCTISDNSTSNFDYGGGGISNYGGTVTVADSTIAGDSSPSIGGGICNVGGTLTVVGSILENNTAIDGAGIMILNGDALIDSCSIKDNVGDAATGNGGGIDNQGTLTMSGSSITGNTSSEGGGIINIGTLAISDCVVSDNLVIGVIGPGGGGSNGVGGALFSVGTATVNDCTFVGNSAGLQGGGIEGDSSSLTITNSTIVDNSAAYYGGGLDTDSMTSISGSTIADNSAPTGAGLISNTFATTWISDSTIASNSASSIAGGILNYGTATVDDSTIALNSGGGVDISSGTLILDNTVVAANTSLGGAPDDINGTLSSASGYNLIGTGGSGGLSNGVNGNQVGVANPGLDPNGLQNNGGPTETIALEPSSPAIDAGSNALAVDPSGNPLPYDQRGPGYPRIADGIVDIGAFEYQGPFNPVPTLSSISPSRIDVGYPDPVTLTVDGSNFASGAVVDWNATALATTYVSPTELIATAPASDFATIGNASITVTNPTPGGGTSAGLTFQVLATPANVFVDAAWAGDALGTAVTWTDSSTHYVGYDAFGTIQTGIDTVAAGGTVDVAAGTYTETDVIAENLTVDGAGASLVTVNGAGAGSVFTIDTGVAATLSGLTITGGYSVGFGQGGGISNQGTATLDDCTISGNSGDFGGGLGQNNQDASAVITDCTISGNSAQVSGGGLWIQGEATLTDCIISGNSAGPSTPGALYGYGGGVYTGTGTFTFYGCTIGGNSAASGGGGLDGLATDGRMKLSDCTISNNSAPNEGGGLLNDGTATLSDCTISGNSAGSGGGLCNRYSTNLTDCTISGNSASTDGGGLMNGGYIVFYNGQKNYLWGLARIEACTISGNSAGSGGGLYMPKSSTAALTDTIVAGNVSSAGGASDIGGVAASAATGTYNLVGTGGWGGLTAAGNNQLDMADPLLSAPGNYGGPTETIALLPGSPAIGAGTAIAGITTDQRGVTLPTSGIDIGGFQSRGFNLSILGGSPQSATVGTAFADPLSVGVTANDPVEPVAGGVVSFTVPSGGASAILSSATATIASDGSASITASANGTAGRYAVAASAAGAAAPVDFELTDTPVLTVTSIAAVSPNPRNTTVSSISVTLNTMAGTGGFGDDTLTLTVDGGPNLITSAVTVTPVTPDTYVISGLDSLTIAEGDYTLTVNAADIVDRNGNPGAGSASTTWLMDTTPPTSTVNPLPATTTSTTFTVSVTGTDPAGSDGGPPSGIASFAIYDSEDGGPFALLATVTPTNPMTTFTGQVGDTYGFYSIATDNAGNVQATPTTAQTTSQIVATAVATTTSLQSSEDPSMLGNPVTFTATVTPEETTDGAPTGSVQFVIDGDADGAPVPLDGGGVATFTMSSLLVGSHTVAADYVNTDGNFEDSSATLAGGQTVTTADTTAAVSSNVPTSVYGQTVTFTVSVAAVTAGLPTPTGTVELFDGTTELGTATLSGGATYSTAGLTVGSQSITAQYLGDGNFSGSTSAAISQVVDQDAATATISSSANPSVLNQSISFTVAVTAAAPGSGTPGGTVQFSVDGSKFGSAVTLVDGVATSGSIGTLGLGNHTITASYSGNADFTASTAPSFTQVANKDNTTTTLSVTANPSVYGQSISFTAGVAAVAPGSGTPTGSVTFADGSTTLARVTLAGGMATYTTAKLATGQNSITATYNGTSKLATSTSEVLDQVVDEDGSVTVVTASANPSVYGQPVTFTATVRAAAPGSGTPTGTVTFYDGTTALDTANLGGGRATFRASALDVGAQSITAEYSGNGEFTTSISPALTQTVQQDGTTTTLNSSDRSSVYGESVTFTATVRAVAPGGGTPTGSVTFLDGNTYLGMGTLGPKGTATFTTSGLSVGDHEITAAYSGDGNFTTSTSAAVNQVVDQARTTTAVVSSADPSVSGHAVTFTATIHAIAPGSGTPTGTATFFDGSVKLATESLSEGMANFTTSSLSVGTHSIKVVYSGDADFNTSTSAVLKEVVDSSTGGSAVIGPEDLFDRVLGALTDDSSDGSSIDDLVLAVVSGRGRRQHAHLRT